MVEILLTGILIVESFCLIICIQNRRDVKRMNESKYLEEYRQELLESTRIYGPE